MRKTSNTLKVILLSSLFILLNAGVSFAQNQPFITVWKTDNLGDSNDDEILVPATGQWDYYWEEVGNPSNNYNSTSSVSGETTISFGQSGTYRLKIYPNNANNTPFNKIQFSSEGDRRKIINIEQWGDVQWDSFSKAFYGCINLTSSANDSPDLSQVTSLNHMFAFAYVFNDDLSDWDVSNVTNMENLFSYAYEFNSDLSTWDVSNVKNMNGMFASAEKFNSDIGNWDVSEVTNMGSMFQLAKEFNRDLGAWNLSKLGQSTSGPFQMNDLSFRDSGMDCDNYSATLKGWAENPNTASDVTFFVSGGYNPEASVHRDVLINQYNWTISGDTEGDCFLSTENLTRPDYSVYPNPTQQQITIDGLQGEETIQLYDMTGRVLKSMTNKNTNSFTLSIDDLPNGVYHLIIQKNASSHSGDGNRIVKKVVKH